MNPGFHFIPRLHLSPVTHKMPLTTEWILVCNWIHYHRNYFQQYNGLRSCASIQRKDGPLPRQCSVALTQSLYMMYAWPDDHDLHFVRLSWLMLGNLRLAICICTGPWRSWSALCSALLVSPRYHSLLYCTCEQNLATVICALFGPIRRCSVTFAGLLFMCVGPEDHGRRLVRPSSSVLGYLC